MIEDYNRYEMARREKLTVLCGLAVMMAFAGYIFYGTLLFCLLPFAYKPGMKAYCGFRVRRRKNQLLIQFRDLLFSLSASFAAGRHMEEAMEEARENLGELYGSRGLMAGELEHMLRSIQETGEGEVELWQSFAGTQRSGGRSRLYPGVFCMQRNRRKPYPGSQQSSFCHRGKNCRRDGDTDHRFSEEAGGQDYYGYACNHCRISSGSVAGLSGGDVCYIWRQNPDESGPFRYGWRLCDDREDYGY